MGPSLAKGDPDAGGDDQSSQSIIKRNNIRIEWGII
jgi:hypothetical protein